jgi:hypothetical protein
MIPAQKTADPFVFDDTVEQLGRNVSLQQAVAVLAKRARVPHPIVNSKADKPAEQQIEIQLLHQLALRADRIKRLEQQRPEQLLRRNGRAARPRIHNLEIRRQRPRNIVHDAADNPKRMALRNPLLQIHIAEKTATLLICSAHPILHHSIKSQNPIMKINTRTFSAAC